MMQYTVHFIVNFIQPLDSQRMFLLVLHDSFFLHDSSIHSKLVVEMDNDGQSCNNTFSINDCQFRYMIYC